MSIVIDKRGALLAGGANNGTVTTYAAESWASPSISFGVVGVLPSPHARRSGLSSSVLLGSWALLSLSRLR